jgi:hypothetical protein
MLREGHRLKPQGVDVAIGLVETHGRAETAQQVGDLEVIPPRETEYRGVTLREMDLDAIHARRPAVCLVDELTHTNAPGSRHAKRYQDAETLLRAGVHVITTLNIQHLESLYDEVERATGVKVRSVCPTASWPMPTRSSTWTFLRRTCYRELIAQGRNDALRTLHPDAKIYTFWDYFRNAFARDNRIRIDHLLLSPDLAPRLPAASVDRDVRGWEKTSDHAPAWVEFTG